MVSYPNRCYDDGSIFCFGHIDDDRCATFEPPCLCRSNDPDPVVGRSHGRDWRVRAGFVTHRTKGRCDIDGRPECERPVRIVQARARQAARKNCRAAGIASAGLFMVLVRPATSELARSWRWVLDQALALLRRAAVNVKLTFRFIRPARSVHIGTPACDMSHGRQMRLDKTTLPKGACFFYKQAVF
jgi:hypothetical protein